MNKPEKVPCIEKYWTETPPAPSDRLIYWLCQIAFDGWRPNRRISQMGYHEKAQFFGVYLWEYLNILAPVLMEHWRREGGEE